jgi:Ni,Fe-hydrogenase III small subunit/ferredoxin
MLGWVTRGLRRGIVTTRYPSSPEQAPFRFRGRVGLREGASGGGKDARALEDVCPTSAISTGNGQISLDRGRCVLCGACVDAYPELFQFEPEYETAARTRAALVVGDRHAAPEKAVQRSLAEQARGLKRSIHIRHVDAGSDGAEEWEIAALTNPYYDMQRLGLFFTLAPRHADVLLVTGAVTTSMAEPLRRAYESMPFPKAVVAAGTDACSGGLASRMGDADHLQGVARVLPVDVYVPGSPPSPIALLHGLLLAAGIVTHEVAT